MLLSMIVIPVNTGVYELTRLILQFLEAMLLQWSPVLVQALLGRWQPVNCG